MINTAVGMAGKLGGTDIASEVDVGIHAESSAFVPLALWPAWCALKGRCLMLAPLFLTRYASQ